MILTGVSEYLSVRRRKRERRTLKWGRRRVNRRVDPAADGERERGIGG